ncbi:GAF and ANTAR domain-containing protein [Wenjunlia tyrosinilytica]|uniref:Transcription antitermination regulator n=1 Tax=Wenjunlia tyrosinilytica TaxID=1544741 RepID=A0A917ZQW1_9ACTN|nr:GAF and ANTAR domain-containing protein [Wenjunlia tyrosinilytica]GGO87718.1 transcription antitermination regulator [Wenjunlia tyrosinilytica]
MELARMFADLAAALQSQEEMGRTLGEVVRIARTTVGCQHAGVTLRRPDGTVESAAATGEVVRACDQAQIETGEGPGLDAIDRGPVLRVHDMAAEDRWPKFAPRARDLGVGSMLACRLTAHRGIKASLNLYAARPAAFDESAVQLAEIFAAHASIALTNARLQETLESALRSRQTIGEATGLVMGRYRLGATQAFDVLVRASQHRNVKLRDIADEVLRDGPGALRRGGGRSTRHGGAREDGAREDGARPAAQDGE